MEKSTFVNVAVNQYRMDKGEYLTEHLCVRIVLIQVQQCVRVVVREYGMKIHILIRK